MGIMDETRTKPGLAERAAPRCAGLRHALTGSPKSVIALALSVVGGAFVGCQTDHAAQDSINQMRAEQLALEDRYASLRNEYEKLRNRMAAKGDAESQNPAHPSALPLTYPPGGSPLDLELSDPAGEQAWSMEESPSLYSGPGSQGAPVPSLRTGSSVIESRDSTVVAPTAVPTAIPTRIQLVDQQTQLTPGPNANSFVLRVLVRSTTDAQENANPVGTYSLRLINPRSGGADSLVGSWQFPAEKIRGFATSNPAQAANGVPLEVAFAIMGDAAPELIAEVEFHPVVGKQLRCRGFVGGAANGDGQFKQWIDTLPVPKDGRGLMRSGDEQNAGPSANRTPAWSPVR